LSAINQLLITLPIMKVTTIPPLIVVVVVVVATSMALLPAVNAFLPGGSLSLIPTTSNLASDGFFVVVGGGGGGGGSGKSDDNNVRSSSSISRHSTSLRAKADYNNNEYNNDNNGNNNINKNNDINNNNNNDMTSISDVRKARLARESHNSKRFASGEELKSLREDLDSLRHNLEWAKALKDELRIESLEKAILNGQHRDPSYMYTKALKLIAEARKMKDASQDEKDALIEKWSTVAAAARELLPEFSLCGLWVGK
jgi:hypothetical protein